MQRIVQLAGGAVFVGGTFWLASYDGVVLDQRWAREFFIIKGLVATAALVLAILHLNTVWAGIPTWAQRLRYLYLLVSVVVIAAASVAQYDDAPVLGRNLCGLELALLACVAMVVSIRQERRDR